MGFDTLNYSCFRAPFFIFVVLIFRRTLLFAQGHWIFRLILLVVILLLLLFQFTLNLFRLISLLSFWSSFLECLFRTRLLRLSCYRTHHFLVLCSLLLVKILCYLYSQKYIRRDGWGAELFLRASFYSVHMTHHYCLIQSFHVYASCVHYYCLPFL